MRQPNLFILGAPKCGTTALADWFDTHPAIFFSPSKEPHYYSEEYRITPSRERYLQLFDAATDEHEWLAEGSVWQLYSPTAVPNILAEVPEARFVVMLRNPVKMAPSMHSQQLFNGNELITDFSEAIALNDRRSQGEQIGVLKGYPPDHLAYLHSCSLGWQLERLFSRVKRDQVHVGFLDDMKDDPASFLKDVYSFLGLDYVAPPSFAVVNAAKVRQFPRLDRAIKAAGDWKKRSGIKMRFGVLSALRNANVKEKSVAAVSPDTTELMREHFRSDVELLSRLTGRDLSHWLRPYEASDQPDRV